MQERRLRTSERVGQPREGLAVEPVVARTRAARPAWPGTPRTRTRAATHRVPDGRRGRRAGRRPARRRPGRRGRRHRGAGSSAGSGRRPCGPPARPARSCSGSAPRCPARSAVHVALADAAAAPRACARGRRPAAGAPPRGRRSSPDQEHPRRDAAGQRGGRRRPGASSASPTQRRVSSPSGIVLRLSDQGAVDRADRDGPLELAGDGGEELLAVGLVGDRGDGEVEPGERREEHRRPGPARR